MQPFSQSQQFPTKASQSQVKKEAQEGKCLVRETATNTTPAQQSFAKFHPQEYFLVCDSSPVFPHIQTITQVKDVRLLKERYSSLICALTQKPRERKKLKATNIPKFLLKIFSQNLPARLELSHKTRLKSFLRNLNQSKTRFDLIELFGESKDSEINSQNNLNRDILRKLLTRNYDNILRNKHIRNKKLYLLFCKKIIMRLDHPSIIDRLEV